MRRCNPHCRLFVLSDYASFVGKKKKKNDANDGNNTNCAIDICRFTDDACGSQERGAFFVMSNRFSFFFNRKHMIYRPFSDDVNDAKIYSVDVMKFTFSDFYCARVSLSPRVYIISEISHHFILNLETTRLMRDVHVNPNMMMV